MKLPTQNSLLKVSKILQILGLISVSLFLTVQILRNSEFLNDAPKLHHNSEHGYSILIPPIWSDDVTPTYRFLEDQYSRLSIGSLDPLVINIFVLEEKNRSINSRVWLQEQVKSSDGTRLKRKMKTFVGAHNYDAEIWNYERSGSFGSKLNYEVVIINANEKIFVIEFFALEKSFEDTLPQFYEILSTLELS